MFILLGLVTKPIEKENKFILSTKIFFNKRQFNFLRGKIIFLVQKISVKIFFLVLNLILVLKYFFAEFCSISCSKKTFYRMFQN